MVSKHKISSQLPGSDSLWYDKTLEDAGILPATVRGYLLMKNSFHHFNMGKSLVTACWIKEFSLVTHVVCVSQATVTRYLLLKIAAVIIFQ